MSLKYGWTGATKRHPLRMAAEALRRPLPPPAPLPSTPKPRPHLEGYPRGPLPVPPVPLPALPPAEGETGSEGPS
jgi:hypothetical protein